MVSSQLAVEVFCSYAHEDKAYCQQLEAHLSVLKRQGLISLWHNRQILPGTDWAEAIDAHLERASIILLLISADFIASDYCYSNEMKRALERCEAGEARVVPIVIRPCYWDRLPIASFQPLPLNAEPISMWTSADEAWTQVTASLQHIIETPLLLSASNSSKETRASTPVDSAVSISLPSDTIDVLITKVGSAIAKSILRLWLKDIALAEDLSSPLIRILESKTSDTLAQRRGNRQFEAIGERVAESLFPIFAGEGKLLNKSRYTAIALAVAETFNTSKLSSGFLIERNLDPGKVAKHLITISSAITQSLSAIEAELYERVIKEACQYIVDIVSQLPTFAEHTLSEILKREEFLIARSNQILEEVYRMRSHIDSKAGLTNFELEYRRGVVRNLDMLELFGFDTSTANRRYRLSTAYITLAAELNTLHSQESCNTGIEALGKSSTDQEKRSKVIASVDEVLANSQRLLICGSPGSGKTTLLRWIAVNAASKGFKKSLSYWNEYIPFYIRLRQFVDSGLPQPSTFPALVTPAIADIMPKDWVHIVLTSGHALVLIDGLDELPESQRRSVKTWLQDLIGTYPKVHFIVTSRPHAVKERWLDRDGFKESELQPMNNSDIETFIHHWHIAIREELSQEDKVELDILEGRLKQEMEQSPPKRSLATNPLLCAMFCALNRDRRQQLPSDRLELYEACCYMLLERRDKERHIDLIDYPALNYRQKRLLLEDLAYWMVKNGSSEAEQQQVNNRFTQKLLSMQEGFSKVSGTHICKFFIERSSLIREPVVGQIDFTHRTFQEFLAAKASVDEMDTRLLIAMAHNDQWREVIILACGFASKSMREKLLQGLITRGNKEKEFRYPLHLLAVSCLETSIELKQELKTQVKKLFDRLVPPKDTESARALASAKDLVVPFLARNSSHDAKAAARCVYTLGLIASPTALNMIEEYAQDTRHPVVEELIRASQSFDKVSYSKRILSKMLQRMTSGYPPLSREISPLPRGMRPNPFLLELTLYLEQGEYAKAQPLYKLHLQTVEQQFGLEHPYTQLMRSKYLSLLRVIGHNEEAK